MTLAPLYWKDAREHLARDPIMKQLLTRFNEGSIVSRGNAFFTLIRSIAGQQISVRAADAVWRRFEEVLPDMTPSAVLKTPEEALKQCGFSRQKIAYMRNLCEFFLKENITQHHWDEMDDESVIQHLTQVKGIGRWTTEMFLIFCLLRPNVFPLDDIGLQRGLQLHFLPHMTCFSRKEALARAECWQPYRSVATWYIWRSIDPNDVGY
jgi:DNA-3-methyladenine glycosylase II